MSSFERLRKQGEGKFNNSKLGLGRFLLVRRIESVVGRATRHRCLGDFLPMRKATAD